MASPFNRGRRVATYQARRTAPSAPVEVLRAPADEEEIVPTYIPTAVEDEDTQDAPLVARVAPEAEPSPVAAQEEPHEPGVVSSVLDRLDPAGLAAFEHAYRTAQEHPAPDVHETISEDDVPLDAREMVKALEGELGDEAAILLQEGAKIRAQVADRGLRRLEGILYTIKEGAPVLIQKAFELLEAETTGKAFARAIEILPLVSLTYAVLGERLVFNFDSTKPDPLVQWEDLDKLDRRLYAVGAIFGLGSMASGMKNILLKKGFMLLLKKKGFFFAVRAIVPEVAKLMVTPHKVAHVQRHVLSALTKKRASKPAEPKPDAVPAENVEKPE